MSGARCLIVEDEYLIRLILAEALADDGFEVIEAGDADEALGILATDSGIDLLLTDIQLPGSRNGLKLARAARERWPGLPVIYMTGRLDNSLDIEHSERDLLIAKPYLPSEVCAAARRLTGR